MFRFVASKYVDVVVVESRSSNHQTVRMERCSGDRGRAIAQEACVRLEVRYRPSIIDVEDFDCVSLRTTDNISIQFQYPRESTYAAKTGACSWTLSVRKVSVVAWIVFTLLSMRMSHSLISPLLDPLTNSRWPPRWR
jgi:hypothetical protein